MAKPDLSQVVRVLLREKEERLKAEAHRLRHERIRVRHEQEQLALLAAALEISQEKPPVVLKPDQKEILAKLRQFPGLTGEDIADKIGRSRRTVQRRMGELIDRGLVVHHPNVGYYLPDNPPPEVLS